MTAIELRQKYPTMSDHEIQLLLDIEKNYVEPKLCSILEPDCESCQ